jgi:hypothetical protein
MLVFGVLAMALAVLSLGLKEGNLLKWEKLPRNVYAGIVLAFIDLLWCVPHTKPLLPVPLHVYLIPAVFVLTWASYQFLDYLLARATGGFFILLTHYFLHESFTFRTPWAVVFAVFCYIMGITGLFFAGKPYLMRDLIRKTASDYRYKILFLIITFIYGLLSLILGIIQFVRGPL